MGVSQVNYARLLLCLHELDADRGTDGHGAAGWLERPGLDVDAKDDDVVGVLIGGEQERARRVDSEIAGGLSPR